MADTITAADLENAKRDADDLALIVNGAPTDSDVETRLGEVVPPVAKVIAGLPALLGDFGFDLYVDADPDASGGQILASVDMPPTEWPDGTAKTVDWTILGLAKVGFSSPGMSPVNPTYFDNIAFFGWNLDESGARADDDFSGFGLFFEKDYFQGVWADEHQLRHYSLEGTERRPVQYFLPQSDDDWTEGTVQFEVGRFNIFDQDSVQITAWDIAGRRFSFAASALLSFSVNNVPVAAQIGPDSNYYNLPYLDSLKAVRIEQPIHHLSVQRTNPNGNASVVYRSITSPSAGSYHQQIFLGSGVTGDFIDYAFSGSVSGSLRTQLINSHATGGTQQELYTTAGSISWFLQRGSAFWAIGMASDNSFSWDSSGFLNNAPELKLKPGVSVNAGYPVVHRSYTVGTLPTPTSGLIGGVVWASNARNSGEGAAAGTGSIVACNGTNWRIPGVSTAVAA